MQSPNTGDAPQQRRPKFPTKLVDAALFYVRQGIPVFPLRPRGKEPITPNGFYDASIDEAQIRAWWKQTPQANIGIPTGEPSGWDVLDFDPRNGGDADGVIPDRPALATERAARTGSGGLHLFYLHRKGMTCKQALYAGVDLKADGGYIVAAPSVHPCGERYAWISLDALDVLPEWVVTDRGAQTPQEAPDWRANYKAPATPARQEDAAKWVRDALTKAAQEGSRNRAGFWLSMQLLDNGIPDPEAALGDYVTASPDKPGDPYTMREAMRSLASAARYPRREPARSQNPVSFTAKRAERLTQASAHALAAQTAGAAGNDGNDGNDSAPEATPYHAYDLTEFGNRDRLLAAHGDDMRYNDAWGFVVWDGRRWQRDGAELVIRRWINDVITGMRLTAADLARQSATASDVSASKALGAEAMDLLKWAARSQTDKMVSAVLSLTEFMVVANVAEFDNAPMLFNCSNGTIDLRTGQLHPHSRADMLTQISPVSYDPDAQAPQFRAFFEQVMSKDADVIEYMQRALGYTITGSIKEQVWHLLLGSGSNGKSTLMDLIAYVMGDYAGALKPESVILGPQRRSGSEATPDIAALKGKRLVTISETPEGARIDAAKIKSLVTDPQTARHLSHEFFTFDPTYKVWLHSNHEPQTRETTHGYWRRVRKVEFKFTYGGESKDLPSNLRAEASGVLAWLVAGCLAWQRAGLKAPAIVAKATDAMRANQDGLRMFLVDRCKRDAEGTTKASELYEAYKAWTIEAGEHAQTQNVFGRMLRERGLEPYRAGGRFKYKGLYLIDPSEVTDETVASWDTDTQRSTGDTQRSTSEKRSTSENPENKPVDVSPVDPVDLFPESVSREGSIEPPLRERSTGSTRSTGETALICPRCGGSDIRDYNGDLRCYQCDERPIQGPKEVK